MVLSDKDIKKLIEEGKLILDPFDDGQKRPGRISSGLSSAGYDLRLGREFYVLQHGISGILDPKDLTGAPLQRVVWDDPGPFSVPGWSFVLAHSVEYIKMPPFLMGIVMGKSTYARLGLVVHITPVEPGWEGQLTIELVNPSPYPIHIYPEEGIAQLLFLSLSSFPDRLYSDRSGTYQGQVGVTLPRVVVQCGF